MNDVRFDHNELWPPPSAKFRSVLGDGHIVVAASVGNQSALVAKTRVKHDLGRYLFPKEDDYKELCCPKAKEIYVGCPAGPPTYIYAAFRSHISL